MQLEIDIDTELLQKAALRATERGMTLEQLVSEFLADFVTRNEAADEFQRLSREPKGNSHGWKFNREEIQRKIR